MFPDLAPGLDAVAGRLVDLLRLTRDHYEHPALNGSYSLKTCSRRSTPSSTTRCSREVQDGLSAQAAYHEAIDPALRGGPPGGAAPSLLEYCALDTLALVRVAHRFAAADAAS